MTKRIYESGTIALDPTSKGLRVCLITEGEGSSARFPRDFFVQRNADALAESLSYPGHPLDVEHPEHRDPLSAIGSIGSTVTIEEHDGRLSFWSTFEVAKSKPQIAEYLKEFGPKLGLSIYCDSDGRKDTDGKWVAESLNGGDAYKSVDLVIAAGRGGKFEKVAESLGLLPKTPATAEEKEDTLMEKELTDKVDRLTVVVEALVESQGKAKIAEAQGKADEAAVAKAVEDRLKDYDGKVKLIAEAKLTESQSADLRAKALTGADITADIESAKTVLAEARVLAGLPAEQPGEKQTIVEHFNDDKSKANDFDPSSLAPGFGKVA